MIRHANKQIDKKTDRDYYFTCVSAFWDIYFLKSFIYFQEKLCFIISEKDAENTIPEVGSTYFR